MVEASDTDSDIRRVWSKANKPLFLLASAVLTTCVGLAGNYIYQKYTARSARLAYSLTSTPPLFGPLKDTRLHTLTIVNIGEQEAKEVRVGLEFDSGTVEATNVVAPPALPISQIETADKLSVIFFSPTVNQRDEISLSILTKSATDQTPRVDVRAAGVRGKEQGQAGKSSPLPAVLSTVLAGIGITGVMLRGGSLAHRGSSLRGKLSQRHGLVQTALDLGFTSLARDYLERSEELRWWTEADYLTARALDSAFPEVRPEDAQRFLALLLAKKDKLHMGASARGIICFDLARLHHALGEADQARQALAAARAVNDAGPEIARRLELHPELRGY